MQRKIHLKTINSGAGFVLIFTVPLVRIMINSGINDNELSSMPQLRWPQAYRICEVKWIPSLVLR